MRFRRQPRLSRAKPETSRQRQEWRNRRCPARAPQRCGLCRGHRGRARRGIHDGWRSRERLSAARRGEYPHGNRRSEDHPERVAGHPLQQAGPVPGQCPPDQGRRLDRGAGRGHRPAQAAAEPERPAGARRRGRGDRHVRGPGRRPALPRARTAGQAEAHGQDPARALRRARRTASPRRIRWPRTSSASRCIRSTSSAPSRPCATRGSARRRSPPGSS